jgi:hypothetical protein
MGALEYGLEGKFPYRCIPNVGLIDESSHSTADTARKLDGQK